MKKIKLSQTWQVGKQIGRGGFGRVFQAKSDAGISAALKLIPKEMGAARELLFEDLTGVRNVIPILDSGEIEDNWALVMPLASKSLRQHLDERGPLPAEEALQILADVAMCLADLAGRAVHRDIKPENVLFLDGHWCLADFGIARYAEASTSPDTHKYAWSEPYNPPERWRHERASSASDIYSLGVMAHEILTGQWPFQGPDFRTQHLTQDPPRIPGIPNLLSSLVVECLFKAPEVRPGPANLLARLPTIMKPASAAAAQLQAANQAQVARAAAATTAASAARSEAERRELMVQASRSLLEMLASRLIDGILENAPAATISASSLKLPRSVSLGNADLAISNANPADGANWDGVKPPFDLVAIAAIDLRIPEDRSQYRGRSHSLWYCDAQQAGTYKWFELAFMFNPMIGKAGRQEPFALPPGRDAGVAIAPMMAEFQLAWPFTPLEMGMEGDFFDRWMQWFAQASQGQLGRPSSMPERSPGGSWRRS